VTATLVDTEPLPISARAPAGPTALAEVLIVIPCLNEAANLPRLLDQFVRQAPGAMIVVADGGSGDGSRAIVANLAADNDLVQLLDNPARIQSAAINAAVARFGSGRRWLVRVDAHCSYPDDFVATLLAAATTHGAASVVVPMLTYGSGCFQKAVAAAQNSVLGTGGSAHRHVRNAKFVDHGHHALMAMAAFRHVGGYDPSFSHNEDAELDHRLRQAGARIWLEPRAAVGYQPRATPVGLFRQYRNYGLGRARTVAKHGLTLRLRQLAPLMILPILVAAVLAFAASVIVPALLVLAVPAVIWGLVALGYGVFLGLKGRSLCATASGVAAIIMHFGWSLGYWEQLSRRQALTDPD
jgi:succinoglycan biosynthesis protein ExoA